MFDRPGLVIHEAMTAADVDGWDSLAHINLIMMVERIFAVKLTISDVRSMKNVGNFIDLVQQKLGGNASL